MMRQKDVSLLNCIVIESGSVPTGAAIRVHKHFDLFLGVDSAADSVKLNVP